jgi:hypothetical protein
MSDHGPEIPFVRKILRSILPMAASVALAAGVVAGTGLIVGHVRHSQDTAWCRKVTPTVIKVKGVDQPIQPNVLAAARASCAAERRSQRGVFGAVWKTGGQQMAACGIDWGRYQQLTDGDPAGATATVIKPYGISGSLDPGSRDDEHRFITACLAKQNGH